jgi:hypothetical protein
VIDVPLYEPPPAEDHQPFVMNVALNTPATWRVFCRSCGDARPKDVGLQEFDYEEAVAFCERHKEAFSCMK